MVKKFAQDDLVKKRYLDEVLDIKFAQNTKEIIEVMNEGFSAQGEIMTQILDEVKEIKLSLRNHEIRLNAHEVRIESLEKAVN